MPWEGYQLKSNPFEMYGRPVKFLVRRVDEKTGVQATYLGDFESANAIGS